MSEGARYISEAGKFEGIITDHFIGELPREKKTPYLQVNIDSDGELASVKLWLSSGAMIYTLEILQSVGWTGNDIILLDTPKDEDNDDDREVSLRGVEIDFIIERTEDSNGNEFYNGKTLFKRGGEPAFRRKEVSQDVTKKLSATSKAIVKDLAKKKSINK